MVYEIVELQMRHSFLLQNDYLVLAERFVLGFVFVAASIDKIADTSAFAVSISYYKLVGAPVTMVVATVLPWVELLCGVFLIFGIKLRGSAMLVLIMLIVFTVGVVSGIARGLDISCGCFSRDPNVGKIGWLKVLENVGLIVLSIAIYLSTTKRILRVEPR
jgi:uncharacterized membrane protein YphA (DoxX/SURF4 family)